MQGVGEEELRVSDRVSKVEIEGEDQEGRDGGVRDEIIKLLEGGGSPAGPNAVEIEGLKKQIINLEVKLA